MFDKAYFEKELESIEEEIKKLEVSFNRLIGIKLYIEDLIKKMSEEENNESSGS